MRSAVGSPIHPPCLNHWENELTIEITKYSEVTLSNRMYEAEKAHAELEEHVLELANLVMDQQKVLSELTKHLIALSQEKEADNASVT